MPYVYRYIDIEAQEVVYIGKVTGCKDSYNDPLRNRHEQHKREEWYRKNKNNLIMQFIEVESHADADILETWLISKYGTGQLVNKAKTTWGESKIDMWSLTAGHWKTYQRGCMQSREALYDVAEHLYKYTEGLNYNVNSGLEMFSDMIKDIVNEKSKVNRLSRYDEQEDFMRAKNKEHEKQWREDGESK